jgi:hypothetical protein
VWDLVTEEVLPNGQPIARRSSFVELATGLHYLKDGQWTESREEIELVGGSAIARQGPFQVIWSANINTEGAIDLLSPDGKRFRSHVTGLAMHDTASGEAVLIAEVKDSIGELIAPNQVLYRDAFLGPFRADLRFTYSRFGFEQDVVIRERVQSPAEYGMNP